MPISQPLNDMCQLPLEEGCPWAEDFQEKLEIPSHCRKTLLFPEVNSEWNISVNYYLLLVDS